MLVSLCYERFGRRQWVFQDVSPGGVAARADIVLVTPLFDRRRAARPPQPPAFPMNECVPMTISEPGCVTS